MSKKAAVILMVVIAGIAGWAWYEKGPSTTSPPAQPVGESRSVAPTIADGHSRPPAVATAAPDTANPPPSIPIAQAPPTPLTQAFESSNNLAQLIRDLAPQVAAGDAPAARIVAQALDECASLSVRRDGGEGLGKFAETMPANRRDVALAHLARYLERCTELASAEKITPQRLREASHAGSLGNDLVDQARKLVESSTTMSAAEVTDTLRRIVQSRDVQAIATMSDAMAQSEDDRELFGPRSGSDIHATAWKLVACDLGMPCGPTSALVRQACMAYGRCIPGDFREVVRFFQLSPWEFELTVNEEREILQDIANGRVDEIFP